MLHRAGQRLVATLAPTGAQSLSRVLIGAGSCKLTDSKGIFTGAAAEAPAEASPKIDPAAQEADVREREAASVRLNMPVDIDVEMDMDEGPEMAVAEGLPLPRERGEPLGRPVDLEYEMDRDDPELECLKAEDLHNPKVRAALEDVLGRPVDLEFEVDRDDPECVDLEELHNPKVKARVMEALGRPVDLEDEFDLMHDQAEGPAGGTLAGNVDMRTGEKAGPEDVGKYREQGPKFDDVKGA